VANEGDARRVETVRLSRRLARQPVDAVRHVGERAREATAAATRTAAAVLEVEDGDAGGAPA